LINDAHAAGLQVHAYTFRAENRYLPKDLRSSADPNALGDLQRELRAYLEAGLDGFFTDHADYGVRARDAFV
jgi:glycerophosphoryl diester phosphodiesterase